VLALATGRVDRLSGRHLRPADDLDVVLADVERIGRQDLPILRPRVTRRRSRVGDPGTAHEPVNRNGSRGGECAI